MVGICSIDVTYCCINQSLYSFYFTAVISDWVLNVIDFICTRDQSWGSNKNIQKKIHKRYYLENKLPNIPSDIYRQRLISIIGPMTPSWYFLSLCLAAVRLGVISGGSKEARTAQLQDNYRLDGDKDNRSSSHPVTEPERQLLADFLHL